MSTNVQIGEDVPETTYKQLLTETEGEFTDDSFAPNQKSIITNESVFDLTPEEVDVFKSLSYARLSEIYDQKSTRFFGEISPEVIQQGCLCNSYFLSAISALAENPERIKKCFVSQDWNKVGCYATELYVNGEKTEIIVDDYIPVYKDSKDIAFSSTTTNSIWMQLLEKAWAKANGGYDKIVFGLSSEVLRTITGAPTFTLDHETCKPDSVWKNLKDGTRNNYPMLCSLDSEKYNYDEHNCISNFSYNVIGTYKVNTSNGNVKLIKIRNPWKNFDWEGDWASNSDLWTEHIKEEVEYESSENGIIFMSLEDYIDSFTASVICKVHDSYEYTRYEMKQDIGSHSVLKLQVNQDAKIFLNLSQLAYRIVPKEYGYKPYNAKMILARLEKDNKDFPLEFINANVDEKDEVALEADLVAGEYYLYCEVDWDENRPHDSFIVSFYGPHIANLYEKNYPSFLEKSLASCAMLKSQRHYYYDHKQENSFRCMSVTDSKCEYGFLFYYNDSKDAVLEEKINFSALDNLELAEPYSGTSAKIKVSAGKSKIVILKRLDRYCKYEVEYKTRFSFGEKKYLEEIYDKGKKIQVTFNKKPYDIFVYTMYGGSDFYFLMENHTDDKLCKAKFKLDLRNMHDIDNPSSKSWVVDIYPGAKIVKKLSTTDSSKKSGVKYSYAFKVEEVLNDENLIIEKVKQKGKKKQIQYNAENYNINFYSSFFQKKFYFLYENNEEDKIFEGNYKFTKTNLKIVGDEDSDTVKVVLQPGEVALRVLVPVDPDQECTISYKYTYVVSNLEQ
ncbi:unnamed protein product [Moneuplotes crassus]|uniref:Calpain catalytic domain-containing protein n=1 Tax=Euplotes crassus TaxID=5936 RepID=A0AAD2DBN6_EUPCR|nr:unnamed protein product [Moneuplotes crassus]